MSRLSGAGLRVARVSLEDRARELERAAIRCAERESELSPGGTLAEAAAYLGASYLAAAIVLRRRLDAIGGPLDD